jgi:hypothetical protein
VTSGATTKTTLYYVHVDNLGRPARATDAGARAHEMISRPPGEPQALRNEPPSSKNFDFAITSIAQWR